jgi:hypothetical protein
MPHIRTYMIFYDLQKSIGDTRFKTTDPNIILVFQGRKKGKAMYSGHYRA